MKITYGPEYIVRAARMLCSGMSYTETARELNVHRATLWRWSKKDLFKKTYEDELEFYTKQLQIHAKAREERLEALLDSPDPKVAQCAAIKILNSPWAKLLFG